MASAALVPPPARPFGGFLRSLVDGLAGDAVGLGEPAAEVDVGATGRAERPVAVDRRLAADRAPASRRRARVSRLAHPHLLVRRHASKGSRFTARPEPPQ